MVVGGTGLYVAALLDGHDYASQPWSPELRARLAEELDAEGLEPLAARLARARSRTPRPASTCATRAACCARSSAPRREWGSRRRRARAVRRAASAARHQPAARGPLPTHRRARALALRDGLLDEVRGLLDAGYGPELRPMTGHGYGEAARHLAGEWTWRRPIAVTARRTRQYAKRQLTWFRRDPRIVWLAAGDGPADDRDLVVEAAGRLLRAALS